MSDSSCAAPPRRRGFHDARARINELSTPRALLAPALPYQKASFDKEL
jgi:hypothetical protein